MSSRLVDVACTNSQLWKSWEKAVSGHHKHEHNESLLKLYPPLCPLFDFIQHRLPLWQFNLAHDVLDRPLGLRVKHGPRVVLVHGTDVHHPVVAALHPESALVARLPDGKI